MLLDCAGGKAPLLQAMTGIKRIPAVGPPGSSLTLLTRKVKMVRVRRPARTGIKRILTAGTLGSRMTTVTRMVSRIRAPRVAKIIARGGRSSGNSAAPGSPHLYRYSESA